MKINKDFVSSQNVQKSLEEFYEKPILRVSIELVMSIVIVSVFALFALRPTLITMSDLLKEIEEKEELNVALQQKVAALATAQTEWTAFEDQVDNLQLSFFQNPSLEEILLYLEYLSRQESVLVTGVSAPSLAVNLVENDEPVSLANLTLVPYDTTFQVMGDYEGILQYLQQIERHQPLMSIETLQLSQSNSEEILPMSATIRLRLYVQQEGSAETENTGKAARSTAANPAEASL
jgi:hypothetical protein